MTAAQIRVGDRLTLKANNNYGLGARTFTVTALKTRDGYKVPWVVCESERPERGLLYFRPSDFARRVTP